MSLGIRCRWGIRNGIFQVAKEEGSDEVLGVAMWLKPRPAGQPATWHDWFEDWRLWLNQVGMNLRYGRGGLIVKVRQSLRSARPPPCPLFCNYLPTYLPRSHK